MHHFEQEIEQKEQEQKEIKEKIATNTNLTKSQKEELLNKLQQTSEENFDLKMKLNRLEQMHMRDMQKQAEMKEKFITQNNMINELMSNVNNMNLRRPFISKHYENDE